MWIVAKFKKESFNFFQNEMKKKIGNECKFFRPKINLQIYKKNRLVNNTVDLLDDYVFCFHEKFNDKKIVNSHLKYTRGLKYILENFKNSQKEIESFIDYCEGMQDENGTISKNFFNINLDLKKSYKFLSGPFLNKIFKILSIEKNSLRIKIEGLNTFIKKEKYLFNSI